MVMQIGALDEVLALTSERAARLALKVDSTLLDGYLSEAAPPGKDGTTARTLFTTTAQLSGEFYQAHFSHPEFERLLRERGKRDQVLFCVLKLDTTQLTVCDQKGAWQQPLSYALDTKDDVRAPTVRDPAFVRRSIQSLSSVGSGLVRTRLQGSWHLFLPDSSGVEVLPGIWLMHALVNHRDKLIVDPARYTVLVPTFFETTTAAVLDFPTLRVKAMERLLGMTRSVSSDTEGWVRELLRQRLKDRNELREIHGEAFVGVQAIPFLWQRYA